MPSFITVQCRNGRSITINTAHIEFWRPRPNGGTAPDSTDIGYRGGLACTDLTPEEFAQAMREANADVIDTGTKRNHNSRVIDTNSTGR